MQTVDQRIFAEWLTRRASGSAPLLTDLRIASVQNSVPFLSVFALTIMEAF
jgi:hypothetical protein